MNILPIRTWGDPVLTTPAEEVRDFGPSLRRLVDDMLATMRQVRGAGLAAPQVGVGARLFTYSADGEEGAVVNPVLELGDPLEVQDGPEGCLSVPGLGYPTVRGSWARVTGLDVHGEPVSVEGTGLLARALQHECDHLDGRLYVTRLERKYKAMAFQALNAGTFDQHALAVNAQRRSALTTGFSSAFGKGAAR